MAATIWGRISPPSLSSTSRPSTSWPRAARFCGPLRPESVDAEFATLQSCPGVVVRIGGIDGADETGRKPMFGLQACKRFEWASRDDTAEVKHHCPYRHPLLLKSGPNAWVSASSFATSAADSPAALTTLRQNLVGMRQAGEHHLVRTRGERDAASQHGMEETRVHTVGRRTRAPSRSRRAEPAHRSPGARKSPTSGPTTGTATASPPSEIAPTPELAAKDRDPRGARRSRSRSTCGEHGEPRRGGQRIARERAGLVHGPLRGQRREQPPAPADGAHRKAPADHLARSTTDRA